MTGLEKNHMEGESTTLYGLLALIFSGLLGAPMWKYAETRARLKHESECTKKVAALTNWITRFVSSSQIVAIHLKEKFKDDEVMLTVIERWETDLEMPTELSQKDEK